MAAVLGPVLVLGTWAAATLVLVTFGLPLSGVTQRTLPLTMRLRAAMWWGLLVAIALFYALSLIVPLGGGFAALVVVALSVILGSIGAWTLRSRTRASWKLERAAWALVAGIGLSIIVLAVVALAQVTHYDAGLYQLSAIRYATDFAAIPGIGNLYGPLAYGGWHPLLGAGLSNGPWGSNGFRLVNGFFMVLVAVEIVLRMAGRQKLAGTHILITGVALTWPALLWMSDYWITSPSPDTATLLIGLVLTAYFVDFITNASRRNFELSIIVVLASALALVKATMAPFAVATVAVAIALALRRPPIRSFRSWLPPLLAAGIGFFALAFSMLRDRMLSGWLFFPLDRFPLDVPWRAPDPAELRLATLGFARWPENLWAATNGWNWVGPWLAQAPSRWELWVLAASALLGLLLLWFGRRIGADLRLRGLILALIPALIGLIVWLIVLPPTPRFGWAPLFSLGSIVLGWALWRMGLWRPLVLGAGALLMLTAVVTAMTRVDYSSPRVTADWWGIPYSLVEVRDAKVVEEDLPSGLRVVRPVETDQCWWVYPLCTPDPAPGLGLIGGGIQDGFQHLSRGN